MASAALILFMPWPGISTYESRGMLISTDLPPLPVCSSISESEALAPVLPRCSLACSVRLTPMRVSDPAISQFVPAEVLLVAGSVTEWFSLPSIQK